MTGVQPETQAERKNRHFALCRGMADLGMEFARDSVAHNKAANGADPAPGRTFARATHAVRQTIALECRVEAGTLGNARPERPRADVLAAAPDPRRAPIRSALHGAVRTEPDPAARTAFRREIDERLELELAEYPDKPIPEILLEIAEALGIHLDLATLPDELLGVPDTRMPENPHAPRYHPIE